MNFDKYTIFFIIKQPPILLFKRGWRALKEKVRKTDTWEKACESIPALQPGLLNINDLKTKGLEKEIIEYHVKNFLDHRFNLLGSGWVKYNFSARPVGFLGVYFDNYRKFQNCSKETVFSKILGSQQLKEVQAILENLNNDYCLIDWQKDVKSGFRWDEKIPSNKQNKLTRKGADIKGPWETARLQFLPQMAIFAKVLPHYKEKILEEFKNVVNDFIIHNPIGYGANWMSTMDVSIRAVNLVIAYDLFFQVDDFKILDISFKKEIEESIYQHALYIVNHLEYSEINTNNHYLSNICSLLILAAYMQSNDQVDKWLLFAIQQLHLEVKKQFNPDGSSFEASTSYHRLSTEMLVYATAFLSTISESRIEGLKKISSKEWKHVPKIKFFNGNINLTFLVEKLYKASVFTKKITAPSGSIVQIGDNDSGRFLKFTPVGRFINPGEAGKMYKNLKGYLKILPVSFSWHWEENELDHSSLVSSVNAFFLDMHEHADLEFSIIKSILKNKTFAPPLASYNHLFTKIMKHPKKLKYHEETVLPLEKELDLEKVNVSFFENFGLAILSSNDFFFTFFAGPNGQNGMGGHSHNDKLSVTIYENGKWKLIDPGTAVYSSFPALRNEFRSVKKHNVPIHEDGEQDKWSTKGNGLFHLVDRHECKFLEVGQNKIVAYLKYANIHHIREIILHQKKIIFRDYSNKIFEQNFVYDGEVSNGYGKILINFNEFNKNN
ncbi:MAG: heparinase II/III family protein [bacterium]